MASWLARSAYERREIRDHGGEVEGESNEGVGRGDPLLEDLEEELGEGGLLARVDGAVLVYLVEV
eukprot:COSAG01_NODE_2345_length_7860_cov_23.900528_2_plen_65_part_00